MKLPTGCRSQSRQMRSDSMDDIDYDYCCVCTALGDDYYINEDGELMSACVYCPHNESIRDDD